LVFLNFCGKLASRYFRTKTVKNTSLLQLVESYRNAEGLPRQRVVVSLGDAKLPGNEEKLIARAVENHLCGHADLLPADLTEEATAWVRRILQLAGRSKSARPVCSKTIDGVMIDEVETENVVQLGPQLVALEAWKQLGISPLLEKAGLNTSQIATAQLLVANRLIEPSSDSCVPGGRRIDSGAGAKPRSPRERVSQWALIDWAERTALPEMLNLRVTKSTKDRLYHAGDALFKHRKAIEAGLRTHEADLFNSNGSIVLYDMTTTHFEGLCAKNPKARHGKNKQKRNDYRQVAIGMAFDSRGLALAHEVFAGNIGETKTLAHMLDRLALPGSEAAKPLVILDAGFASKANIALLKERSLGYVINITRGSRALHAEAFAASGFELVPGREAAMSDPPLKSKPSPIPMTRMAAWCFAAAHCAGRKKPPCFPAPNPASWPTLTHCVNASRKVASKTPPRSNVPSGDFRKNIPAPIVFMSCVTSMAHWRQSATRSATRKRANFLAIMCSRPSAP
jgi:hypothetical protein